LRRGGNAVDAAVVTAAVLGVTEPYVEGLGGSAYMTVYLKDQGRAVVIGSRTPAPQAFGPEDRDGISGTGALAVGVPTTLMSWKQALERFGTLSLQEALQPAIRVAREGFVVEPGFVPGPLNRDRFLAFTSSRDLFYGPDGELPEAGSVFRNPDLADAYKLIAKDGVEALYGGPIGRALAEAVQHPPLTSDADEHVAAASLRPGKMQPSDLAGYRQEIPAPTHVQYRGRDVFSSPPPSSGGSTVGEALNILDGFDLSGPDRALALHRYLEASKLAYADRARYVGDPGFFDVPLEELLSQGFADERRCLVGDQAMEGPIAAGDPTPPYDTTCSVGGSGATGADHDHSTQHFSVVDGDGNAVSYTGTLVWACGSGLVVPGYGFCLNNEMPNFNARALFEGDPNVAEGGKRPRGNMAPTVVVDDGRPVLSVGAAGGQTIQTTVLGILVNHLDFGMGLPDAMAAGRAAQRNTATTLAEHDFLDTYGDELSTRFGHEFTATGGIADAQGVSVLPDGRLVAVGGAARVLRPER
ncbi:MAG: gamma-glutamyltransferase family protein, partial [Gaiellales bacterium]